MSRLDPAQMTLLKIEAITKSFNGDWTKQEILDEINQIIDKYYE
mgnify:FL=1